MSLRTNPFPLTPLFSRRLVTTRQQNEDKFSACCTTARALCLVRRLETSSQRSPTDGISPDRAQGAQHPPVLIHQDRAQHRARASASPSTGHPYLPQNHPICACLQSSAWVYLLLSAAAPVLFLSPSPSSVHPCRAVQASCSQPNSSASSWCLSLPCSLRAIPFKLKSSSRSRP